MVPTIIGAFIGMATASVITASPMLSTIVMLVAVIGLQYAIAANRNSGVGVALLLLMTGLLGWWLGPILNFVLAMRNGMQLVGYAAAGTGSFSSPWAPSPRPPSATSASWASSCSWA
jgi:modulator of FtsH protease